MSPVKFALLLALVIGSAGLSVWVAVLAIRAEQLDGATRRALIPLVMLAAITARALIRGRAK